MTTTSRGFIDVTAPVEEVRLQRDAVPVEKAARRRARPGSVRHSVTLLVAAGVVSVLLLAVTDGMDAAALGLGAFVAGGIVIVRYVAGGGAGDGGYRRPVRLLGDTEPVLGSWEWLVHNALGPDGAAYFEKRLRPQLQRLFAARLAADHGTDLYGAPSRAGELIGPDLWPWLDPSGPPPQPAIPEAALRALLDRLEGLTLE